MQMIQDSVCTPYLHTSSDGQFFPAGGRGEAAADYNARHGSEPGSVFYDFLSDRVASYFSEVIAAAASEAPYVLDGLMHHESMIEIREHATDTAGAVEAIFAMFHLFGYRFAPRIRDLSDRKLFVIDRAADYGVLKPLIGGAINCDLIDENWPEVLRLAASIKAGTVPPSVILKKIAAFPRQNALNRTFREIGRIERSIFTCDWLLDPDLRRRSHGNLNKGESRHALARAVFFHRLGELRDRTAEAMAYRASGLNLVVNATSSGTPPTSAEPSSSSAVTASISPTTPWPTSHRSNGTTSRSPATTSGPISTNPASASARYAPTDSTQRPSKPLSVQSCRNSHATPISSRRAVAISGRRMTDRQLREGVR